MMVIIDGVLFFFERNKRHFHTLEFWLFFLTYYGASYFARNYGEGITALPMLLWGWRIRVVRNVLGDVSGASLKRSWHLPALLSSFILSFVLYLNHFSFAVFTFPIALIHFIIGVEFIAKTHRSLKARDKVTPPHLILLFGLLVYFVHSLDFAFLRYQTSFSEIGFTITLLLTILLAVILPALTIFELQRDQHLHLEKIIRDRAKQLTSQAKFSALGEMTAGIVHEINNPLSVVRHRSSHLRGLVLKDKATREVLLRNLDQIEITSERMTKIVNSLRRFSKKSDEEEFQITTVASILEDTLSYCSDRFYYSNIVVKLDPYPVKDVECHPIQISQVILNLLNNSYDALKGTSDPWVKIQFVEKENILQLRIIDSGKGIPANIRKRIMEPFFTTKKDGGTGLGLSISLGIVEEHGGRLYLDENEAHTTFVMELPYRQSM